MALLLEYYDQYIIWQFVLHEFTNRAIWSITVMVLLFEGKSVSLPNSPRGVPWFQIQAITCSLAYPESVKRSNNDTFSVRDGVEDAPRRSV